MTDLPVSMLFADLAAFWADTPPRNEEELQDGVARYLQQRGWGVVQHERSAAGEADLVARSGDRVMVIETKRLLSRRQLFSAAGQVLAYKAAINPAAEAVVIGYASRDTHLATPGIEALGVTVVAIPELSVVSIQPPALPLPSLPHPHSLSWNVQSLALGQGFENVSQLARVAGLNRQGLYHIWNGTARQVTVRVLGQLALVLEAEPGDWFRWEGKGRGRRLVWDVATVATSIGLGMTELGYRASLHHRMVRLYYTGTAVSVFVDTLRKLAEALRHPHRPFDIGSLFRSSD